MLVRTTPRHNLVVATLRKRKNEVKTVALVVNQLLTTFDQSTIAVKDLFLLPPGIYTSKVMYAKWNTMIRGSGKDLT